MVEKRKVGRPRKEIKVEDYAGSLNPDCEMATKGFVKRLLRKLDRNNHSVSDGYMVSACITMAVGVLSIFISMMLNMPIGVFGGIFAIMCAFIAKDILISILTFDTTSKDIQKFEFPKEECEE